ncbi:carbon-phosphorus lyase complex subunit PhnI [Paenibacillus hamazuiensis]|uniref:carbon-phosphorus lyase complex subunit PhnI n=1 Tax=Paenibacillus hamazuiensis TaxID=2936508 RepID=UPI00200CB6B2|nr:carbon-phosphorus lyase complex subunit PhnI [Paenibacillus hamazuiensis]
MAYVAVTGGREAIAQADRLTEYYRVKDTHAVLPVEAVEKQLRLLVDRIMSEGGLYAPEHAALALKQAEGDPAEAAFLIRAYRSTLPRNHYSLTVDPADMRVIRRISSSFRDIPGGQVLGPTYDYTHRMLKFGLREERLDDIRSFVREYLQESLDDFTADAADGTPFTFRKVADLLREQGLMGAAERAEAEPFDITREKLTFPAPRSARLQTLARGETGAMTALAYSSMRGYGAVHPTIGELRVGYAPVYVPYPGGGPEDEDAEQGSVYIGEVLLTEVESINSFTQNKQSGQVQFVPGYGLCFGQNELKAISMSILERSLETEGSAPAQDEEFVLIHIDSVESNGFVSHLKLPHYITFQSSLDRIRETQARFQEQKKEEKAHETEVQPAGV